MKDIEVNVSQEKLNRRSAQLRKMIDEANALADMCCAKKDEAASAGWRKVAAHLTMAHGEARLIKHAEPDMPTVQFGGDGK